MDKLHVMEQFAALAGLSMDEALDYSCLADAAMLRVERGLRPDADPAANAGLLDYLCAALCYFSFAQLGGADEEGLKALDLSVTKKRGDRLRGALRLRDEALVLAKDLLADPGFYFKRT